jgi:hypothetical protein
MGESHPHSPKRCASCDAPIFWARYTKKDGSTVSLPIDAEPVQEGNIRLVDRSGGIVAFILLPRELEAARAAARALKTDPKLRVSHFSTCPNADKHRQRGLNLGNDR